MLNLLPPAPNFLQSWLQVRLDFRDLRARLDWALTHDQEAHLMADAARRVATAACATRTSRCMHVELYRYFSGLQGVRVATSC